jgi:hypothetical protein
MKYGCCILSFSVLLSVAIPAQNRRSPEPRKNIPLDSIVLSDPFIMADQNTSMYYMTGTGGESGKLLMSIHSHKSVNGRYIRVSHLFEVDLSGDRLVVGKPYIP